ncbi:MAG: hypothetical protein IPG20_19625 [Gammaproteobacteria bacterium]|nr:hypothetical protein [Gammaproteobacteria bacterium]MBK6585047.1 hypothetical protein [Gammaproteobacteria bacterium]MBK9667107.1 hypothetical protein [Gammaproteobacteria bacterium]
MHDACESAPREDIPGDFVGTGVWRGGPTQGAFCLVHATGAHGIETQGACCVANIKDQRRARTGDCAAGSGRREGSPEGSQSSERSSKRLASGVDAIEQSSKRLASGPSKK